MIRKNNRPSGWIGSRELIYLAKPLAVLLAMVFSLSIHIDASIAAGSNSPLCLSAKTIDKQDGGNTSRRTQIAHCLMCSIVSDEIEPGILGTVITVIDTDTSDLFYIANLNLIARLPSDLTSIRAPPVS